MNAHQFYSGTMKRPITRREVRRASRSVFEDADSKGDPALISAIDRPVGSTDRRSWQTVELRTVVDAWQAAKAKVEMDSAVIGDRD